MDIIIEGPDGSGKSTLIKQLVELTGFHVIPGQGPEKYPHEMNHRAYQYNKLARFRQAYSAPPHIYDRHPCVSHPIYSLYTPVQKVEQIHVDEFYRLNNLYVYCQPRDTTLSHERKEYDTDEHQRALELNQEAICGHYEAWGLKHAHVIHRWWEEDNKTVSLLAQLAQGITR